ncbi:MAG: hypothetical protein U5M53_07965 [Rhodoferax sp.]|nr:hypothetical protein [Rhodoferax sp.]
MRRIDLEHLIRACSEITQEYELVVIGSQAILGTHPNPPAELTVSAEPTFIRSTILRCPS